MLHAVNKGWNEKKAIEFATAAFALKHTMIGDIHIDKFLFFAVGGVNEKNIEEWFDAGIDGVGLGSDLVKRTVKTDSDLQEVMESAKKFRNMIPKA